MYFWNQPALEKQLANEEISEWDKTKYYIAFAILNVLGSLSIYIPFPSYKQQGIESLIGFFVTIGFVVIVFKGIKSVFMVNKKIDNSHFIERITCLSFPLAIKFIIVLVTIILILAFGGDAVKRIWVYGDIFSRILIRVLNLFWIYVFYIFLRKSFTRFGDFIYRKNKELNIT